MPVLQSASGSTTTVHIDEISLILPDFPFFLTVNSKWGGGSSYSGGQDVYGPGIAGGTVTYSYMPAGVPHWHEYTGGSLEISRDTTAVPEK